MKTFLLTIIATFIFLSLSAQTTYVVFKPGDPDPYKYPYDFIDEKCDPVMYGTLQWAIRKSLDTPGECIIVFNIPGQGPFVILLNFTLPAIEKKTITIDATTQPGYSPGNPQIILDGNNKQVTGLYFNNNGSSGVKGMVFKHFVSQALLFNYCNYFEISDNYFTGNGTINSRIEPASLRLVNSTNGSIKGNFIGIDESGNATGNNAYGMVLSDNSNSNTIGGTGTGEANTIVNNIKFGIWITKASKFNKISGNIIYGQDMAVYLYPDGNGNKHEPYIGEYNTTSYILKGNSDPNDIVEVFGGSANQNAYEYITTVQADSYGSWLIQASTNYPEYFATATDMQNNTSPLSHPFTAPALTTGLKSTDCDISDVMFSQVLTATPVFGAGQYEFNISEPVSGLSENIIKYTNTISLNEITMPLQLNTLYFVTVRVKIGSIWGQYGSSCKVKTVKSITIEACKDEQISYTVSGVQLNDSISITINLPADVYGLNEATTSPATIIQTDITNPSAPQYSFTAPADSFTFYYHIKTGCENFSTNNQILTDSIILSINGNTTINTNSYTLNSPWIVFDPVLSRNITNDSAFLNVPFTRTFVYRNTGNIFTGDFLFKDVTDSSYNNTAVRITGITCLSPSATVINSDTSAFIKLHIDSLGNDTIVIRETVILVSCPAQSNNVSHFNAFYGCADDSLCTEAESEAVKTTTNEDPDDKPVIRYELLMPAQGYPVCWNEPQERIIRITNVGIVRADSTVIEINKTTTPFAINNITKNVTDSIEIYKLYGSYHYPLANIDILNTAVKCHYKINELLLPDSSIYIKYYEVINCIDSLNYSQYFNNDINMHFEGFPLVTLWHKCNPGSAGYDNQEYTLDSWHHVTRLHQVFINYIGTMNGGDYAWFDITGSTPLFLATPNIYSGQQDGFIFNVDSSAIQVKIKLDKGLGLVKDSLYLLSSLNGVPARITAYQWNYYLGTIPDTGNGNIITANFRIPNTFYTDTLTGLHGFVHIPDSNYHDFFNNFKVHFKLRAYCEHMMAVPSHITEEFYFIPNTNCNPDCKLPIASKEDSIKIHCPGCVLPGWNLSSFDIRRSENSIGYSDNDNNNFPDSFPLQTADTALIEMKNAMIGDTLIFDIRGSISDGGILVDSTGDSVFISFTNVNINFDFRYGQLELTGSVMDKLRYIEAKGEFTDTNNIDHPFDLPLTTGRLFPNEGFVINLDIDTLNTYFTDSFILDKYWMNNYIHIKPVFRVDSNFTNPYTSTSVIDAALNMSGVSYNNLPGPGIQKLPDANAFSFANPDTYIAMDSSQKAAFNYWCTGWDGKFGAVGVDYNFMENDTSPLISNFSGYLQNFHPCKNVIVSFLNTEVGHDVYSELYGQGEQIPWNVFSFELRNLFMLDSVTINFPKDFYLDSVIFINTQLTSFNGIQGYTAQNMGTIGSTMVRYMYNMNDVLATDSSATIYPYRNFDSITAFPGNNGPLNHTLFGWDESKRYRIFFILGNDSCAPPLEYPDKINYPVISYISAFPGTENGDSTVIRKIYGGEFTRPDAALVTTVSSITQDAANTALNINLNITTPYENSPDAPQAILHGIAENTFIYIHSPSGTVTIDSIVNNQTNNNYPVVDTIGSENIYGLGMVGFNWGAANTGIYASYDCENITGNDSILVYTGWNCAGYTNNLNNVCFLDSQWVIFPVFKPGLQDSLIVSDTLNLCGTIHYDLLLTATGIGNVDSVVVNIPIPQTGEFSYEPGSAVLFYNGNIFPVDSIVTGTDTLSFNLSAPGLLDNFYQDTAHFIFDIIPACSFYQSLVEPELYIFAMNDCGNVISLPTIGKRPHIITGLPVQDSLSVNINVTDSVSGCGDSTLVQVTITNNGTNLTSSLNTLNVILPNNFSWLSGDAFADSTGQAYTFNLAGNIIPAGSQTIQFYISGISGSGIYNVIANTYVTQAALCNNDTCIFAQSAIEAGDTVQFNVSPPKANVSTVDATCNGYCNGSAVVTAEGIAPLSYLWSTGANTQNVSGLCAGNYGITVTDANGCADTVFFIISEPVFIATINSDPGNPCTACTGSAFVVLTGGIAPFSYEWSNESVSDDIFNLCPGTYSVTVTDNSGCTAIDTVTIINNVILPPVAAFTITSDTNCIKQGVPVQFSAGSQAGVIHTWDFGDGTTATGDTVNHTFTDFGYFQIVLSATNSCGGDTICSMIFINPPDYDCSTFFDIASNTVITGSNNLWDVSNFSTGIVRVKGNVYIPSGQTLTITGINVKFAPKAILVVAKGGRLVINNSNLDGLNGTCMWQGIEVWGVTSLPSSNSLQGKITVNNSSINNAYIGVLLGKRADYTCTSFSAAKGGFDTKKSGGVIIARNTVFTGNGMDIRFMTKTFSDVTTVNVLDTLLFNCPYPLNDNHYDISSGNHYPSSRNPWAGFANADRRTDYGIISTEISRLRIRNCDFKNLEYGIYTFNNRRTEVSGCDFRNHRQGIHVDNYLPSMLNYYDITMCTFDSIPGITSGTPSADDGIALYIAGGRGDRIHDGNDFRNTIISSTNPTNGIKTNNASGFYITNNIFNNLTNGITIQNSAASGGYVMAKASSSIYSWFGNRFTSCNTGITTKFDNLKLCLRCNDHNNGTGYITNWENTTGGALADQGFPNSGSESNLTIRSRYAAGNTFAPGFAKDINSPVLSPYNYYHHILPLQYIPAIGSSPITLSPVNVNVQLYTKSQFCPFPPTYPPIINLPVSLNDPVFLRIDSLNNVALMLESQYLTLLNNADKGHTIELLNAINAVPPTGQLKNMLIADSPLSDTVLKALNIQNPLSNGNYKNVMEENLPVTRNVVPSFNSRVETLPPGIKNQLKDLQANNPGKITTGYLETLLGQAKLTKQLYFNEIIALLLDTFRYADAVTLFEQEATPEANMILAATYLSDSNYSSAAAKIALLPDDGSQYSLWKEYSTFLLNHYAQGKTLEELDSSQIEYIRMFAYRCPEEMATVNAKAILMFLFREEVPVCPENGTRSMRVENNKNKQIKSSYLGENYPDPFSKNTIIPYYLPEGAKGELIIKDVTGRIILALSLHEGENTLEIDSKGWTNGVYFYGMNINNENITNKKMIKTE